MKAHVSCETPVFPDFSMIIPLPALAAYRRDLESLGDATVSEPELERALGQWVSFGAMLEALLAELPPVAQKDEAVAVEHLVGNYARRLAAVADRVGGDGAMIR